MEPVSQDVIAALARFDSPTICNTIELFDCRPRSVGALSPRIRAMYPELPPMVGYAVTLTARSAHPPAPAERSLGLLEQVAVFEATPAPRVVVIQDLDDPPLGAAYGEVMASTYQAYGCVGLVTNGLARDVLQVRDLRFPCFATGTSVSHAYCRILSAGQPVHVGGVTIRPGDLLHGDANGVTTIPLEIAEPLARAAAEFIAAENELIEAAKARPFRPDDYRRALGAFVARREEMARRYGGSAPRNAGL